MRRFVLVTVALLVVAACGDDDASVTTGASSTTTTAVATTVPQTTTTIGTPAISLPVEPVTANALMERGPLGVGITRFSAIDPSRGDREVEFKVRYPAITDVEHAASDAPADRSGAPYPVILTSRRMGDTNGNHYASHGFVVVEVHHEDNDGWAGTWLLDTVFDRLLALDALEDIAAEPLSGLADTARAGNVDYSNDTLVTIALAGAPVDPDFYRGACADAGDEPPFDTSLIDAMYGWDGLMANNCMTEDEWDEFETQARDRGLVTDTGLWEPIADSRIKAGIAGGPEGAWLFGERGLAAAESPILLWAGSDDDINVYAFETAFYAEHLGSPTELISLSGADHFEAIQGHDTLDLFRLFSTAYFHDHLHGSASAAAFVTQDFVENLDPSVDLGVEPTSFTDVVWGYVDE